MTYDLDCRYDRQKSFYGKAKVRVYEDDNMLLKELISYTTKVASYEYDKINNKVTYRYLGHYSATTTHHQKEFFKQEGLDDNKIKILIKEGEIEIWNN